MLLFLVPPILFICIRLAPPVRRRIAVRNAAYRKAFTAGLVASSAGLLTKGTANTFVDQLLGATGLSGLNSSNIAQKANTVSTIVNLLQTLKQ